MQSNVSKILGVLCVALAAFALARRDWTAAGIAAAAGVSMLLVNSASPSAKYLRLALAAVAAALLALRFLR
jgi:membrane-bound ClpP family serine protease